MMKSNKQVPVLWILRPSTWESATRWLMPPPDDDSSRTTRMTKESVCICSCSPNTSPCWNRWCLSQFNLPHWSNWQGIDYISLVPPGVECATPSLLVTPNVKLPKLLIKKYNRYLTKWVTFWHSFDSSIHSNPSLSNVNKFKYLNSFVESATTESISGLILNYEEAVATLNRFDNTNW